MDWDVIQQNFVVTDDLFDNVVVRYIRVIFIIRFWGTEEQQFLLTYHYVSFNILLTSFFFSLKLLNPFQRKLRSCAFDLESCPSWILKNKLEKSSLWVQIGPVNSSLLIWQCPMIKVQLFIDKFISSIASSQWADL